MNKGFFSHLFTSAGFVAVALVSCSGASPERIMAARCKQIDNSGLKLSEYPEFCTDRMEAFNDMAPADRGRVAMYVVQEDLLDGIAAHNFLRMVYHGADGKVRALDFNGFTTDTETGQKVPTGFPWSHDLNIYANDRPVKDAKDRSDHKRIHYLGSYTMKDAAPIYARVIAAGIALNGADGMGIDYWPVGTPFATQNSNAALNTLVSYAFKDHPDLSGGNWAPGLETNLLDLTHRRETADALAAIILKNVDHTTSFADMTAVQEYMTGETNNIKITYFNMPDKGMSWSDMSKQARTKGPNPPTRQITLKAG